MNNLMKEQILDLAKLAGYTPELLPGSELVPFIVNSDGQYVSFAPSLTGSIEHQAQACRVIVAANKDAHEGFITRLALGDDPLSAASLALISGGRS